MKTPGALFLLATGVLHAIVVAMVAPGLPDRVPTHFGASGVDSWSSRSAALWMFGLLGAGTLLLFAVIALVTEKIPTSLINAPNKDWWTATPERESLMRRRMTNDMFVFGGATMLLITLVTADTSRAAQMENPEVGWVATLGLVGYLLFTVAFLIWMVVHRFARGPE